MNLLEAVVGSLRRQPAKVVCRDAERTLTAEHVLDSFRSAAEYFASSVATSRVGILLPNCALYPAAVFGAIWAGKVPVPLNPLLKSNELDFIFKEAGIDTVVVGQPTLPTMVELGVRSISIKELVNSQAMPSSRSLFGSSGRHGRSSIYLGNDGKAQGSASNSWQFA